MIMETEYSSTYKYSSKYDYKSINLS